MQFDLAYAVYHLPVFLVIGFGPRLPRLFSIRGFDVRDVVGVVSPSLLTAPLYSVLTFWLCGGFGN
jgi:hypothetical protein